MPCGLSPLEIEQEFRRKKRRLRVIGANLLQMLGEMESGDLVLAEEFDHLETDCTEEDCSNWTRKLCEMCTEKGVTSDNSLELQIWWRDHQAADLRRQKEEAAKEKLKVDRIAALAKLSDYEKKILGLENFKI